MDLTPVNDRLYIAARPRSEDASELAARGVRLVLNMIPSRTPSGLRSAPFRAVWLPWLDSPRLPIPTRLLWHGAVAALQTLQSGEAVLTYCREGRHRSVAMACTILITQGMTAPEAMDLVTRARPVADPHAPHVTAAIRRFEASWNQSRRPAS
jgi:protein tyrosine phosphatase (PTP) superfamily phosphohydrolase (DUF442 family)